GGLKKKTGVRRYPNGADKKRTKKKGVKQKNAKNMIQKIKTNPQKQPQNHTKNHQQCYKH
ncbi:hypothetical protein ACNIRS_25665, partial [Escherichia coli]